MIFGLFIALYPNSSGAAWPAAGRQTLASRRSWRGSFVALCLALPALAWASNASHESIRMAVEMHLQSTFGPPDRNLDYDIGQLDPRLNLHACDKPLQVSFPPGTRQSGYTTVAAECQAPVTWKIHVPVTLRRYAEVLVAVRHLPRGHRLEPGDVRSERREISRLTRGYYTRIEEINGQVTRQAVRQARVIHPAGVVSPRLVQRGDDITIIAHTGNLTIHARGTALMDGHEGDRIRVRNLRSQEELQAIVTGLRQVKVTI